MIGVELELGLAIPGVVDVGLKLFNEIKTLRENYKDAEDSFKDIQTNVGNTRTMLQNFDKLVLGLHDSDTSTTGGLFVDLENFKFEISMIEEVYTTLLTMLREYMGTSLKDTKYELGELGKFTATKLKAWKKLDWSTQGLGPAMKLGERLRGHRANLSFALQVAQAAVGAAQAKKMQQNHEEIKQKLQAHEEGLREQQRGLEELNAYNNRRENLDDGVEVVKERERQVKEKEEMIAASQAELASSKAELAAIEDDLRQMQILHVNNTRVSDLRNNPLFLQYLESAEGTAGVLEPTQDLDFGDDSYGQRVIDAEDQKDGLILKVSEKVAEVEQARKQLNWREWLVIGLMGFLGIRLYAGEEHLY